jgi:PAS domain S-box-containing protein
MISSLRDGLCIDINNSCLGLFGCSRRRIIGKAAFEAADPNDMARLLRKLRRQGFLRREPVEFLTKSGQTRRALWSADVTGVDGPGGEDAALSLFEDVTEFKQMEDRLRQSEVKYRSVVDHIGIGIALISPKMEILALNPQMRKWFPQVDPSLNPVCYKSFNNPPRRRVCSYCPTFKTLKDGEAHEALTETPSGAAVRNFRIISTPIRDRDGKISAAIEMVEDCTEKMQIQEQLKDSEKWYRTIFEATSSGTVVVEEDLTISHMNKAFEDRTGFSKSEVEGRKKWTDFIAGEDLETVREFHRAQRSDPAAAPGRYETRYICRGGKVRYVLVTAAMVPGTRKCIVSLMDITRLKRAERSLKEREEELSIKSCNLEELNAALRALLKQRDEDRLELEENVLTNVKTSVLPLIGKMQAGSLDRSQRACLETLDAQLREIISPFLHRVTQAYFDLTPQEVQVAGLVRDGMPSKEIAGRLGVSIRTVDTHRDNIRKKLGIKNRQTGLRSFLLKFS